MNSRSTDTGGGPSRKRVTFTVTATRWRVGRSLGRTIYAQTGDAPSKDDELVGLIETRELAAYIVALHNTDVDRGIEESP